MKKIVVASNNPVKMNATLSAFKLMFPEEEFNIEGVSVPSGVKDQPTSDEEALEGATNRANGASEKADADYYVGIEGGVDEKNGEMCVLAWIVIRDKDGNIGKGKSGLYYLPQKVVDLIHEGKELGEADDIVFGKINSKQGSGSVGILTNDLIDRTKYYLDPAILALIPFKNSEIYF